MLRGDISFLARTLLFRASDLQRLAVGCNGDGSLEDDSELGLSPAPVQAFLKDCEMLWWVSRTTLAARRWIVYMYNPHVYFCVSTVDCRKCKRAPHMLDLDIKLVPVGAVCERTGLERNTMKSPTTSERLEAFHSFASIHRCSLSIVSDIFSSLEHTTFVFAWPTRDFMVHSNVQRQGGTCAQGGTSLSVPSPLPASMAGANVAFCY